MKSKLEVRKMINETLSEMEGFWDEMYEGVEKKEREKLLDRQLYREHLKREAKNETGTTTFIKETYRFHKDWRTGMLLPESRGGGFWGGYHTHGIFGLIEMLEKRELYKELSNGEVRLKKSDIDMFEEWQDEARWEVPGLGGTNGYPNFVMKCLHAVKVGSNVNRGAKFLSHFDPTPNITFEEWREAGFDLGYDGGQSYGFNYDERKRIFVPRTRSEEQRRQDQDRGEQFKEEM